MCPFVTYEGKPLLKTIIQVNVVIRIYVYTILFLFDQKEGEGIQTGLSLAIPAFHVYVHKLQCQVMFFVGL